MILPNVGPPHLGLGLGPLVESEGLACKVSAAKRLWVAVKEL